MFELTTPKLKGYLETYGAFPAKYRPIIWKYLLNTPRDDTQFKVLSSKIPHFESMKRADKVHSCLAQWNDLFSKELNSMIQSFVAPFLGIKVFRADERSTFECIASILCKYASHWFHEFPSPPTDVLLASFLILDEVSNGLCVHFKRHSFSFEEVFWRLSTNALSTILGKEDWQVAWDHILTNGAQFFHFIPIAFALLSKNALMLLRRPLSHFLSFVF